MVILGHYFFLSFLHCRLRIASLTPHVLVVRYLLFSATVPPLGAATYTVTISAPGTTGGASGAKARRQRRRTAKARPAVTKV